MNTRLRNTLVVLVLAATILLPRIFHLDQFTTADEKRWLANTNGFVMSLAHGKWDNLLQQQHPGITTQWLAAPTVFSNSWAIRKLPLVISQSILVLITGYVFWCLWGGLPAILVTLLLALNPLLVAHTRVYAMDSLLSHFLLLSVGLLILWDKTNSTRYLVFSGIAGALAVLSKLPGLIIVPFAIGYILYTNRQKDRNNVHFLFSNFQFLLPWLFAFLITLPLVLPSLITSFVPLMQNMADFYTSEIGRTAHHGSTWYYIRTLIFFSTPLHIASLIVLPFVWTSFTKKRREQLIILLVFAALFIIMMSFSMKKGDRYILPVFPALDVITALIWTCFLTASRKNYGLRITSYGLLALLVIQAVGIYQHHPYTLAYVNPITKPFFGERRLGWGEGLDLAAEYLNEQPHAEDLKVAAYYPSEFSNYFKGETIPLHQWDSGTADYAVLYRAMYERGPDAWETDILNQFKDKAPEKIIKLNGLEYAWLFRINNG